jgi:hypothetical protein
MQNSCNKGNHSRDRRRNFTQVKGVPLSVPEKLFGPSPLPCWNTANY